MTPGTDVDQADPESEDLAPASAPRERIRTSRPPMLRPGRALRVLVADDDSAQKKALSAILTREEGYELIFAETSLMALGVLRGSPVDLMIADLTTPSMVGLDLARLRTDFPDVDVIATSAYADIESAISALKSGACDFLVKPLPSADAVRLAVYNAAERKRLRDRVSLPPQQQSDVGYFGDLVGNSPAMDEVFRLVTSVACTSSTVLVLGESGTGKELIARAIHQHSNRADKPFVAVNCGAIPSELVESELFGHLRGAFTGALKSRSGLFEDADTGTIFLDEVGDLPLAAQVKLLRTLQEGEVKRVGANETTSVDVRVIAATNADLKQQIAKGAFRRDLFYRLNVIAINVPPLRQRADDVVRLAFHFLRRFAAKLDRPLTGIHSSALNILRSYSWPGNVRELENVMEHATVMAKRGEIHPEDLPQLDLRRSINAPAGPPSNPGLPTFGPTFGIVAGGVTSPIGGAHGPASPAQGAAVAHAPTSTHASAPPREPSGPNIALGEVLDLPYSEAKRRALESFDRSYVEHALRREQGNVSAAARRAGLDRSNFRRLVKKHDDP
jgi:DNA-binding NtrC family response regulator